MKKRLLLALTILLFGLSLTQISLSLWAVLSKHPPVDLVVYMAAINRFYHGQNPYRGSGIPYNYPPSTLILLTPLFWLTPWLSVLTLSVLSVIALTLVIWIMTKGYSHAASAESIVLIALFLQTFPVKFNLVLGQINLIVLCFTVMALYWYPKRPTISAISLAISVGLKLFPLALLPLFLLKRDYKYVGVVSGLIVVFHLLAGWQLAANYYLHILPALTGNIGYSNFYDQSIVVLLIRMTHQVAVARYGSIFIALGLYISFLYIFMQHKYKNETFQYAAWLILSLCSIGGAFSWQHHIVFSYPLIIYDYYRINRFNPNLSRAFVLLSLSILAFHFKTEQSTLLKYPLGASYQTVFILGLLLGNLVYIIKDKK